MTLSFKYSCFHLWCIEALAVTCHSLRNPEGLRTDAQGNAGVSRLTQPPLLAASPRVWPVPPFEAPSVEWNSPETQAPAYPSSEGC